MNTEEMIAKIEASGMTVDQFLDGLFKTDGLRNEAGRKATPDGGDDQGDDQDEDDDEDGV
jgi:hypothetical protein